MKSYSPGDLRVVGLIGHRNSGKTSLIEGFLFNAKATPKLGSVEAGNQTLESDPAAIERHTTMQCNVGYCEWDGVRINLIDTPGDANFWGATNRALQVIDGAVLTVSGVDGIEPITARAVAILKERRVPFVVFVTKLDKEGSGYDRVLGELKTDLSKDAVPLSIPIGDGPAFKGVVSLLTQKAYYHDPSGKARDEAIPADLADDVSAAREKLFDAVAAADDALAEKYLEDGSLNEEDLARGLKAAFLKGEVVPVLCGAANLNVGTRATLAFIRNCFPSPLERPAIKGTSGPRSPDPVERRPDPAGPFVAQIFRTHHDAFAGTVSYARVWSGTWQGGDVYNGTRETGDRPSKAYVPQGGPKNGVETKEISAGELIAFTKLSHAGTGDTLCSKDDPTFLPKFDEPQALLNFGIGAHVQKDEDRLSQQIIRLVDEDPSLHYERDPETKQMLLGGLGQAHIDYVVDRLKRQGIEVELKDPKVPYRETIRAAVRDVEGKHKKQTGGHGQFAVCYIHVEPLPRGSGFEFVDAIVGGSIPRNFIPSVEKGILSTLKRGPLSGNEVVDIKVTVYDGKFHRVDSSDMAFQLASRKGIKAAFANPKAKPALLEPVMELDISCPADQVGDIIGDLNSRRGRIINMTTEGRRGRVSAYVPMNEVLRYANVLKSLTSGQGNYTMKFHSYEEAPPNVQQQVMASYTAEAEEENDE